MDDNQVCLNALPEAAEGDRVVLLPDGTARGHEPVVAMTLSDTTALAARRCETTHLTVLHHRLADPVDARIGPDDTVSRVHHDHLEVLVHTINSDPIRVEHAKVAAAAAHTLLSHVREVAGALELVDGTGALGLTPDGTLVNGPLAGTTAHTHAVDYIALLGLVPEPADAEQSTNIQLWPPQYLR
jgi:hypothetical protein